MEYKLSAQLQGHESDVRDVAFPKPNTVISVSRDNTVRTWHNSSKPPSYEGTIITNGSEFINSVAYLPANSEYPDGLIISGGKDTIIEVKKPNTTPADNAERLLIGHAHNICSLDVSPKGSYVVSGSWDKQAIVWKVGKWEPELRLEGHDASVWSVLALDETTVVTGAADEKINIYDLRTGSSGRVRPRSTIHTSNVVRAVVKVPQGHPSGAEIASAHSDGVIRLWALNGSSLGELHGHDSFVYSLTALPTGELVSSGEDRSIRIWKGFECIQTITVPAISVWSVAVCKETGDIVAGSSDGVARVFTKNSESVADAETITLFEDAVKASSIPQQQMDGFNKEKLPGPDFIKTKSGTKEGQVQMIREENGSVTAHQWSQGQWINVGTVVDTVGSSGKKVEYLGQSYDYVFDVDIEDGAPPLKLPYNLSQNPYEAATKFLGDNELPLSYLDNVANFITQNTQGATIGQDSAGPAVDEFGTGRYQPGQGSSSQQPSGPKVLPLEGYLTLATAKFDPVVKKIMSISATMISAGRKDFALNPTEEATLKALTDNLGKHITSVPGIVPGTSTATPKSLPIAEDDLLLVLKLASQWPDNDRLPGLDLLRCLVTSPNVATLRDPAGHSIIDIAFQSAFHPSAKINENCAMMAFRVVANLFATAEGRGVAFDNTEKVVDYMESLVGTSDSAFAGGPVGFPANRNVLTAVTTAAVNYAVLAYLVSKKRATVDGETSPEVLGLMANVLCKIVKEQSDAEVTYRALAALGTLAAAGFGKVMKSFGADEVVRAAKADKNAEARVRDLAGECLLLLK
ncbi:WD repeat protein Lub1 [Gnomoniopsis sp. IMI 355080]|nr:WD repeat protein Lub1 [Gnomoniopsis sp. IMI 355080]